jgi:hypothetical protein
MAFIRDMTPDEVRDQRIATLEVQVRNLSEVITTMSMMPLGTYRIEHDPINGGPRLVK